MPIWLRNLTFVKIKEHSEKEQPSGGDVISQNRKTLQSAGAVSNDQKVTVPSYVVKAKKK